MDLATYRVDHAGVTQQACAEALGLKSKSVICEIERGGAASPLLATKIEMWSGGKVKATDLSPTLRAIAREAA